jgi:predicted nucleic acid-binding protein
VKLIIDANIVVSCILKTDSRLSQLYFDAQRVLKLIAPDFLREELIARREKLVKLTGQPANAVLQREILVLQRIEFIDPGMIPPTIWLQAEKLVKDVDMKDIAYVALSLHTGFPIWSGDKKLRQGLALKGWNNILGLDEVQTLVESL